MSAVHIRTRATKSAELETLIAAQEKDARSYRASGVINAMSLSHLLASGPDGLPVITRRGRAHDERHGTLYCYKRLRCRCLSCQRANADYQRGWRSRQVA